MENKVISETSNTEMVTIPRAEYEDLKAQNQWLLEQLRVVKSKQFGSSSEKASEEVYGQLSLLFNEAEVYAEASEKAEEPAIEVRSHTRQRKSGKARDILPENAKVVEETHTLSEEERICPECGEVMQPIGTEVQEKIQIIPAQIILHRDIYVTYACQNCKENNISTPILETPKEPTLIPGSYAYEPGYGLSFHVSNSNDNTETIYDSDGAFMVTRGGFFSYSTTDRPHVCNAANDPEFVLKPGDPIPEEAKEYIHTTPAEIQTRANALLEQMGLSDQFRIFEIRLIPDKRWAGIVEGRGHTYKLLGYGYQVTYTRLVNGVPVCAKNGLGGKLFWYEEKMAPQWIYETMFAFFDDSEEVAFDWGAPIETQEVIESNCRLLPFSEIQSEMENKLPMLLEKSINRYEHCEARVQRIELGLWRIREKNNIDAGLLVPVYCFYLDLTYRDSDGDDSRDTDILIINAVDGTVIDPYNGY